MTIDTFDAATGLLQRKKEILEQLERMKAITPEALEKGKIYFQAYCSIPLVELTTTDLIKEEFIRTIRHHYEFELDMIDKSFAEL